MTYKHRSISKLRHDSPRFCKPYHNTNVQSFSNHSPSSPPIDIPKANQCEYRSAIKNVFILRRPSLNKPYSIPTQSQRIPSIQYLSLCILQSTPSKTIQTNLEKSPLLNKIIQHSHSSSNIFIQLSLGTF